MPRTTQRGMGTWKVSRDVIEGNATGRALRDVGTVIRCTGEVRETREHGTLGTGPLTTARRANVKSLPAFRSKSRRRRAPLGVFLCFRRRPLAIGGQARPARYAKPGWRACPGRRCWPGKPSKQAKQARAGQAGLAVHAGQAGQATPQGGRLGEPGRPGRPANPGRPGQAG